MPAAESDLCKLADVRAWLEMADGVIKHDGALQRLITACSGAMQRYMQRTIAQKDYRHNMSGPGSDFMLLPNYPIVKVSSITVDGSVVPASNISHDSNRTIFLDGQYRFNRGRNNIALRYSAGFDVVPVDLVQACVETVGMRWREHDRIGLSSKGLAGETTTFNLADFSRAAVTLMNSYQNKVPA